MAAVAFIGLGNMGSPMAANLLKAGHNVRVYDLVPAAMEELRQQGAQASDNIAGAVESVDFVISMLPAGKHVESLYLGENGVLNSLKHKPLLIDCSTIDVATVKKVAAAASANGLQLVDAPVSGGVGAATAGTLTFMCGGEADACEAAKAVLQGMGAAIFRAGDQGAGQVAKICNNMLLAIHMMGTAEALQLGVNNGLDPAVLSEIMLQSSGRNWSLEKYNPYPGVMPSAPASNEFKPGFMSALMLKDLGLAMENSLATNSTVVMGALARNLYASHCADGNANKDFSSILNLYKKG